MARKKKFNDYFGFNWNTEDIQWVEGQAKQRDLNASDVFREGMKIYRAIIEGAATLIYNKPVSVQAEVLAGAEPALVTETPEPGTGALSENT